jgi:uncharacterized membrane protein YgcG
MRSIRRATPTLPGRKVEAVARMPALLGLLATLAWALGAVGGGALAAGPPFPEPVTGVRVYDVAEIWSEDAKAEAQRVSLAIEERVGAQVVVYSQVVDYGVTGDEAKRHAAALINQWGVGRAGYDDGYAILFDIDPSGVHGQVAQVAGDGFRATYLPDEETQRIIDDEVLPHLVGGSPDFDAAMLAAIRAVDRAATAEQAALLQAGRVLNAVIGLIVAPILGLLLIGLAVFQWLRFGRDPEYLDSPSILMPAPPDQLTAASGALVYDGQSSRRTLTTALLDLASRGRLAFEDRPGLLSRKVAVVTRPGKDGDDVTQAWQRLADRRPLSDAELFAERELRGLGAIVEDDELLKFGTKVGSFDERLEAHAVAQGWFREPPRKAQTRWSIIGGVELAAGIGALALAMWLPASGLTFVAIALGIAGIVTLLIARVMPARTMAGAMIRAMLAAYRRTLKLTMEQARSMGEVVERASVGWLETPDQALVWGVALGLQDEVDGVLRRSLEDLEQGRAAPGTVYLPVWYGAQGSGGHGGWSGGGGSVFSGSAIPNVGGMIAVLGSVGNAPSSSDGGGGGFGGGGGGGGGGSGGF